MRVATRCIAMAVIGFVLAAACGRPAAEAEIASAPASPTAEPTPEPSALPSPTPSPTPFTWKVGGSLSRYDGSPLAASVDLYRTSEAFCENWRATLNEPDQRIEEWIAGTTAKGMFILEVDGLSETEAVFIVLSAADVPGGHWFWNGTTWTEPSPTCGAAIDHATLRAAVPPGSLHFRLSIDAECTNFRRSPSGPLGTVHYFGRAKVLEGPGDTPALQRLGVVTLILQRPESAGGGIGIAARITGDTAFEGVEGTDLKNTVQLTVLLCANSYDPARPFPSWPSGTYVLSRVRG